MADRRIYLHPLPDHEAEPAPKNDPPASVYLSRAERVIKEAAANLDRRKGECGTCKWSRITLLERMCDNPVVALAAETVTQAYNKEKIRSCSEQRDTGSFFGPVVCGPDAELYEPGFWARLFGSA